MAKKEIIKIKDEELFPTTIGLVENKEIGLLYLVFIFIIFIAFVFAMPYIYDYFNSTVVPEYSDVEIDGVEYYSGMSIIEEGVTFSNIDLNNNILSFVIINTGTSLLNLSNDNMFLEVYDFDNVLITRIDFENITVASAGTYSYAFELSSSDLKYLKFDRITVSDYPEIELNTDEDGTENLVCIKDDLIMTYEFSNSLLNKISSKTFINENDVDSYITTAYQYNQQVGVEAYVENEFDFYFSYTINLSSFVGDLGDNESLFSYKTNADTISFEMINKGFDCN